MYRGAIRSSLREPASLQVRGRPKVRGGRATFSAPWDVIGRPERGRNGSQGFGGEHELLPWAARLGVGRQGQGRPLEVRVDGMMAASLGVRWRAVTGAAVGGVGHSRGDVPVCGGAGGGEWRGHSVSKGQRSRLADHCRRGFTSSIRVRAIVRGLDNVL